MEKENKIVSILNERQKVQDLFDDMFKGIDEMEMIKEADKKSVQHKPKIIKFKR